MIQTEKIWNKKFVLLFMTNLLMMAAFYASIPIIPIYCQQIGITGSKIGIVLTAMSIATVLFRPVAGYLLDNFNRYRVYLLFLGLFCLAFPSFIIFPQFGALVLIRLYMGVVYSVCGSATMTLAGDVLPRVKVTEGISRFALTISIGMAFGPYVGIQVQNHLSSKTSFLVIFAITLIAFLCVSRVKLTYAKVERKKFALKDALYKPALPFILNMMFLMVPFGAVLIVTIASYAFMTTGLHLLIAGFLFGLGYGILQPLFQAFVTGTTPAKKRGVANATYMLSYDIGIGIGSFLIGGLEAKIGLANGFALTAIAYVIGGILYALYVDRYYQKLQGTTKAQSKPVDSLAQHMEHEVYALQKATTVREAIGYFAEKHISGAPIVSETGAAIGFLSDGDIMRYLREEQYPAFAIEGSASFMALWNPETEFAEKLDTVMDLSVFEIGAKKPITIAGTASLEEVCKLLSEANVKKVPITAADGKVIGIVTRSNITRYLTRRYLARSQKRITE